MIKRFIITAGIVITVILVIGGIKGLQIRSMIAQGKQYEPPPVAVNTAVAQKTSWEQTLSSVGTLSAVQGVMVTSELPGKIVKINFSPGASVSSGDALVQQDVSSEKAQLRAAEAAAEVARLSLQRARKLLAQRSIAQSEVDNAEAKFKQAASQVDTIRTAIEKKTIRAPFDGKLGIRLINLGQFVTAGEAIVSLQTLDPIFVDFFLPQQDAVQVEPHYTVRLTSDALAGNTVEGRVTAINPQVDPQTRAIKIQATVKNSENRLLPGMFVNVQVVLPEKETVTIIPSTAVLHAPYGDSVFVVMNEKDESTGDVRKVLRQQFIRLGEMRGDYVALLAGLDGSETLVSTGVFKLRNGQAVIEDNTLAPEFTLNPELKDS